MLPLLPLLMLLFVLLLPLLLPPRALTRPPCTLEMLKVRMVGLLLLPMELLLVCRPA